MAKRAYGVLGIVALLAVFVLVLGLVSQHATPVNAQTKGEICDNGTDDDGDKKVDCADEDCANDPACQKEPPGEPCSPGYWKNHPEEWAGGCGAPCGSTEDVLAALSARGPGSSTIRAGAAACLDTNCGRLCNDD